MDIRIRLETPEEMDPELTSRLARQAFLKEGAELSAERFSWSYRGGYDRIRIVSAFADGAKVGQLTALFKKVVIDGQELLAAELVDLFVSPEFRGFKIASSVYKEMQRIVAAEGAGIMFAYANEGASVLNRRFFSMEEVTQLPARLGFSGLLPGRSIPGVRVLRQPDQIADACLACTAPLPGGGVELTREQLRNRIGSPVHEYLCATDGDVAILASPRVIRSVPLLLVCATFTRKSSPDSRAVGALVKVLCRAARRSTFLHVGWNDSLALQNGYKVPERLLRGKFLIQSNFLESRRKGIGRFELLDVDYG